MGRYKKPDDQLNTWVEWPGGRMWEYKYYKCCMLGVSKDDDGKYIPLINGSGNIKMENWSFLDNEPLRFDTLEEAQLYTMKYMDYIRAKEVEEFKRNEAYRMNLLKAYVDERTRED